MVTILMPRNHSAAEPIDLMRHFKGHGVYINKLFLYEMPKEAASLIFNPIRNHHIYLMESKWTEGEVIPVGTVPHRSLLSFPNTV